MLEDLSETELASWLEGYARDIADLGGDKEAAARLKQAARLVRETSPADTKPFPYVVIAGGRTG
ncbi:hypothetical protein [Nitratireductor thuwali]|uniref:Uncharacterized protein n=1 Tax=Nitratireductor thuwali TaxID=2267699 RepID=A0ABY5MQM2_9HYPH|nr:hypothetical protein NTH_03994 [Nitratireductor thuwali]